jgi:hypothetical protein
LNFRSSVHWTLPIGAIYSKRLKSLLARFNSRASSWYEGHTRHQLLDSSWALCQYAF